MPEPDDIAALRAANTVAPASLPSAHSPEASALFERIVMTDTTNASETPEAPPRPILRRPALLAGAAAIVALAVGVAALAVDDSSKPDTSGGDTVNGPITPGGPAALCVEIYDLTTLANREMAFDGTVTAVDGDSVTFDVGTWFRGGTGSEITLGGASALGGITSTGGTVTLEPGTRLLVAGDDGFAWSCEFTQPYDADVAAQWQTVFAGG